LENLKVGALADPVKFLDEYGDLPQAGHQTPTGMYTSVVQGYARNGTLVLFPILPAGKAMLYHLSRSLFLLAIFVISSPISLYYAVGQVRC